MNNVPCVNWIDATKQFPDDKFPDVSVGDARNYCRNPDNSLQPWCFIETTGKWDFCEIPLCGKYIRASQCGSQNWYIDLMRDHGNRVYDWQVVPACYFFLLHILRTCKNIIKSLTTKGVHYFAFMIIIRINIWRMYQFDMLYNIGSFHLCYRQYLVLLWTIHQLLKATYNSTHVWGGGGGGGRPSDVIISCPLWLH